MGKAKGKKTSSLSRNPKAPVQVALLILGAGIVALIDQIIKWIVKATLASGTSTVEMRLGLLGIEPTNNTGAAFSLARGFTWLFIAVFIVAAVFFINFLLVKQAPKLMMFGMILFLGGGLANCIDRIRFGAVFDFIRLTFITFPVFNIADICITVGTVIVIVYLASMSWRQKQKGSGLNQKEG